MTAYLVADLTITDADGMADYQRQVPDVIAKYGGRYLVRGGVTETVEGTWRPNRLVIVEFPDLAALQRFYASPDYAPLLALRQANTEGSVLLAEGYDLPG